MKTSQLISLVAASSALTLVGCSNTTNAPPPQSMHLPADAKPTKIPTTVDEKIKAIENAPLPKEEQEKAIAKVKAGNL